MPLIPGKQNNPHISQVPVERKGHLYREMVHAFRSLTPEALTTLSDIMMNEDNKPGDRIEAAKTILRRGWGPEAPMDEGDEAEKVQFDVVFQNFSPVVKNAKQMEEQALSVIQKVPMPTVEIVEDEESEALDDVDA